MRTITVYGPSRSTDKCPVTIGECTSEYNGNYSTSCPCDYLLGYAPARYPVPAIEHCVFDQWDGVFFVSLVRYEIWRGMMTMIELECLAATVVSTK